MLTKEELPACPWATTIQLIGNKWKLFILRELFLHETCRFGELKKEIPGISTKVLTENLRTMEEDGLSGRAAEGRVCPHRVGKDPEPDFYRPGSVGRDVPKSGAQSGNRISAKSPLPERICFRQRAILFIQQSGHKALHHAPGSPPARLQRLLRSLCGSKGRAPQSFLPAPFPPTDRR